MTDTKTSLIEQPIVQNEPIDFDEEFAYMGHEFDETPDMPVGSSEALVEVRNFFRAARMIAKESFDGMDIKDVPMMGIFNKLVGIQHMKQHEIMDHMEHCPDCNGENEEEEKLPQINTPAKPDSSKKN